MGNGAHGAALVAHSIPVTVASSFVGLGPAQASPRWGLHPGGQGELEAFAPSGLEGHVQRYFIFIHQLKVEDRGATSHGVCEFISLVSLEPGRLDAKVISQQILLRKCRNPERAQSFLLCLLSTIK